MVSEIVPHFSEAEMPQIEKKQSMVIVNKSNKNNLIWMFHL